MHLSDIEFKRKFSFSPYKDMKIPLATMTFAKDFVNDTRGDLYPALDKDAECKESILGNRYSVSGRVRRMFCDFFPYGSYQLFADIDSGAVGFTFNIKSAEAKLEITKEEILYRDDVGNGAVKLPEFAQGVGEFTVSCRPGAFDIYLLHNGRLEYFHTFISDSFISSDLHSEFSSGYVSLSVNGKAVIKEVSGFIDNGISLADMRTVRYENGDVMIEDGKVYFTASVRLQAGCYQGVFSWVPGTMTFEMTGAIFYDAGDGKWCNDVAASMLYHREKKKWLLWVCSFAHDHILAHAEFSGDVRFGVNVLDVELMKQTDNKNDPRIFSGFPGDEDPDFFFSEDEGKWYMAICRLQPGVRKYRYTFFKSDDPFEGYEYIGSGYEGEETGGSFVKIDGRRYFVCGNSFKAVSDYRIYDSDGMKNAKFNFSDGGFRGWGTVIPVQRGNRTRLFWITFDRHKGSSYNWSYGNFYCFEGEM